MPRKSKEEKKEPVYAGPWVSVSSQHFVRHLVDIHAHSTDVNTKPVLGKVFGKTKKGIATWTWHVIVYGTYYATSTGTCRNKREAIHACDESLKQTGIKLLKQKHFSFL